MGVSCSVIIPARNEAVNLETMIPDVSALFPEAEMLHYLDMIDAKMFDMQDALEKTEPGEFSDRVRTLDNRTLYRVKDE